MKIGNNIHAQEVTFINEQNAMHQLGNVLSNVLIDHFVHFHMQLISNIRLFSVQSCCTFDTWFAYATKVPHQVLLRSASILLGYALSFQTSFRIFLLSAVAIINFPFLIIARFFSNFTFIPYSTILLTEIKLSRNSCLYKDK